MDLGQIKYFILVARLQNMSKAAQTLGIAQPTLSRSISNLEKELGTQLFDRSGKKLILNERGRQFLDRAQAALDELESAANDAKRLVADRTLNIGLFTMSERLMSCLCDFAARHTELVLNIHLINDNSSHIDTNEFDILLYPKDALRRRYKGKLLYSERFLLAVECDNVFNAQAVVAVQELAVERLIFLKRGENDFDSVYHMLRGKLSDVQNVLFCNSYEVQRQMIAANLGIGFVPEGAAETYRNDARIKLLELVDAELSQEIYIGFKRGKHLSNYGRLAAEFISEFFK